MLRFLTALLLVGMSATPAAASTLPPLDGGPGFLTVAAGVLDLNLDVGIGQRLSAGVSLIAPPVGIVGILGAAGRVTIWATDPEAWFVLGATLSGGITSSSGATSASQLLWAQPALNLALASGRTGWALRATLGPLVGSSTELRNDRGTVKAAPTLSVMLIPNVELAYRFSPSNELTLGGNSLIGWRGRY